MKKIINGFKTFSLFFIENTIIYTNEKEGNVDFPLYSIHLKAMF